MFRKSYFTSRLAVSVLLAVAPLSSALAASLPLSEVLSSRAGRLIFGELLEGSLAANRILGTNVANPTTRMQRMIEALTDARMQGAAAELDARVNRIYDEFAAEHPSRADKLFRGTDPAAAAAMELADADRRLIRDLVSRELDHPFIDELGKLGSYHSLREDFLAGEEAAPRSSADVAKMSPQERALVFWETQKNAVATRSTKAVAIEHFEIPVELVDANLADRISPELRDSLIFKKNGKEHVRWIINPEDTKHYKAVEKYLKKNGADATHYKHFEAYQTASRSYIVVDPTSDRHVVFSAKVSTDVTGGHWTDKKQPYEDAAEARRAVDFVRAQEALRPYKNVVTMDEPAMFGIQSIDQAMLVRVLGDLPDGQVTYLPGFSAVHDDLGVRIAHANGSDNPAEFWNEHYNKPLARAVAELAARTGLTYDSPHSQNFLIEMVGVVPTGRIVMRDFGDTYASKEFFEAMGRKDFLDGWEKGNITKGTLDAGIGVLHGNEMPSWINDKIYDQWGKDFYKAFESEFSAQTGVPEKELAGAPMRRNNRYFGKDYDTTTAAWRQYLDKLKSEIL